MCCDSGWRGLAAVSRAGLADLPGRAHVELRHVFGDGNAPVLPLATTSAILLARVAVTPHTHQVLATRVVVREPAGEATPPTRLTERRIQSPQNDLEDLLLGVFATTESVKHPRCRQWRGVTPAQLHVEEQPSRAVAADFGRRDHLEDAVIEFASPVQP